ncbi:hypothetical protein Tco_1565941, partial [Tanacetum coccineum]
MERRFLSQKGSGGGRGVKEKQHGSVNDKLDYGNSNSKQDLNEDTLNEDTVVGVASAVKEGVTPPVVDMMVEKQMISS